MPEKYYINEESEKDKNYEEDNLKSDQTTAIYKRKEKTKEKT